jgi:hypothetical protein
MSQFRPWTITALTAGLTGLDLSLLKMSPHLWQQLLRQIDIPTLLKFHVSGDAPVASVISFLPRHAQIRRLRITQTEIHHPTKAASSHPFPLSYLSDLSGPACFVKHILSCLSAPPQLECLTILPDMGRLRLASVSRILGRPACDQLKYLSISLPVDAAVSVLNVQDDHPGPFSCQLRSITFSSNNIVFDDDILVGSSTVVVGIGIYCFSGWLSPLDIIVS